MATFFQTVEEVRAFFAEHGVTVLNVGVEGNCLAAEVATDADIVAMEASGLEIDSYARMNGARAVVFYPARPSVAPDADDERRKRAYLDLPGNLEP